jgi:hypothetical protein
LAIAISFSADDYHRSWFVVKLPKTRVMNFDGPEVRLAQIQPSRSEGSVIEKFSVAAARLAATHAEPSKSSLANLFGFL